jgi:acetolactate synthase I/II/III large subunit
MHTVAENIVRFLETQAVEYCFGIPGAQTLELYDALVDSKIKSVLTTNESCAAFMADGYARVSGKAGVCLAIAGPGVTNMATGLAEALVDSSPVVALVAAIPEDGKAYHIHEIDQLAAVKPLVKAVFRPKNMAALGQSLAQAFSVAPSGEPGPVVVEIPTDWFQATADLPYQSVPVELSTTHDVGELTRVADLLLGAKQCGFYLGRGALGAAVPLRQMAEILCAPVATTVSGKGVLPEDHPLSVGYGFGPSGSPLSQLIFRDCDVVLAVGCKFSELASSKWEMSRPARLIHVDRNPAVLDLNYPATIALVRDARDFARELLVYLKSVPARHNQPLLDTIAQEKAERVSRLYDISNNEDAGRAIDPARLLHRLRTSLAPDAIVVTDVGNHQLWAISEYPVLVPGTFVTPSDYQSMGFGIPAAIGAALARPGQPTVCLCGDGGFLMTCMELLTAVRERLNLTVIVFNDGALGLIKNLQEKGFARESSVALPPLDYRAFAQSIGVKYVELANEEALNARLTDAIDTSGVTLVNARVTYQTWAPLLQGMSVAAWNRLPLTEKLNRIQRRAGRALRYLR